MKKRFITIIILLATRQFSIAQTFTTDVTINATIPSGHSGGYNALWFPNAAAVMPENSSPYSGIYLTSNVIRNGTTWGSANSSLPAWNLYMGNGPLTDLFQIARSATGTYNPQILFRIANTGNVLIGETSQANTAYLLDVNGAVRAKAITVNTTGADFVFEPGYKLLNLPELKDYILKNHHLPEIASAKDMQANGLDVGYNQVKLLQKVEELTLYIIDKDKQLAIENEMIKQQQRQIDNQQHLSSRQAQQLQSQQEQIDLLKKQMELMIKHQ